MKVVTKYLRFENIVLEATQNAPNKVARVRISLTDPHEQKSFKTPKYGLINQSTISWQDPLQIPYTAQFTLSFSTECQHEYGYQLQSLNAEYTAMYYVKPQQFFRLNTVPAFTLEGKQSAILRFTLKIVEREQGSKQVIAESKDAIDSNLVGKLSFVSATLIISGLHATKFYSKTRRLSLHFTVNGKQIISNNQSDSSWKIDKMLQLKHPCSQTVTIVIKQDGNVVLSGEMHLAILEKFRRFLVHSVSMHQIRKDEKQSSQNKSIIEGKTDNQTSIKKQMIEYKKIKIGELNLQMRYVSKLEVLDLMYSPKKLQQKDMKACARQNYFKKQSREPSHFGSPRQLQSSYLNKSLIDNKIKSNWKNNIGSLQFLEKINKQAYIQQNDLFIVSNPNKFRQKKPTSLWKKYTTNIANNPQGNIFNKEKVLLPLIKQKK